MESKNVRVSATKWLMDLATKKEIIRKGTGLDELHIE